MPKLKKTKQKHFFEVVWFLSLKEQGTCGNWDIETSLQNKL